MVLLCGTTDATAHIRIFGPLGDRSWPFGEIKMLAVFRYLCLLVGISSISAKFRFEFELLDVDTKAPASECDPGSLSPSCDTYLSVFCLRGRRSTNSTNSSDCPLGSSDRIDAYSGLSSPQRRSISGNDPWPVSDNIQQWLSTAVCIKWPCKALTASQ